MGIMQLDQSATQIECNTKKVQREKILHEKSGKSKIWNEKNVHKNSALECTNQ